MVVMHQLEENVGAFLAVVIPVQTANDIDPHAQEEAYQPEENDRNGPVRELEHPSDTPFLLGVRLFVGDIYARIF